MKDINNDQLPTKHEGQRLEIDTGATKWQAQELGVNSNVPLVDAGTGKPYIIRQFEFSFNPKFIKDVKEKKTIVDKQAIFNSHWKQLEITLWGDGLVPRKDIEPRIIIGKRKYKIVLLCEPRLGVMVAEKAQTLQEITKSGKNAGQK